MISRHIFKANAGFDPVEQVSLTLDMIAVSGVYARGNENNRRVQDGVYYLGAGKTDAYALFNAAAEVRPVKALTIFTQVSNLFDEHYASAAQLGATGFDAAGNFVARPFTRPVIAGERPLLSSTFYGPGTPRAIRIGAQLRF